MTRLFWSIKKRNKEEAVAGEALRTPANVEGSIATLYCLAEDWSEPSDIRIKAKELRIAFVGELQGVLAAEMSSDPQYDLQRSNWASLVATKC
jgi:hypothetical protein